MQLIGNLDASFLARELDALSGLRLDNAYQCGEKDFRFRFGKQDLVVRLGEYAFLSERAPAPSTPSQFAMLLRKHLRGARVTGVEQIGFDRLLRLWFGEKSLVFELFSKGNLLLLDGDKIVRPFRFEEFSSRTLRPGEQYSPPPSTKQDPRSCDLPESGPAVPSLARKVNLSPFYLEEACARAGVGFREGLDAGKAARVGEALKSLFEEELKPTVYFWDDEPSAFAPFLLKKFEGEKCRHFDSFSEALSTYYSAQGGEAGQLQTDFIAAQRKAAIVDFGEQEAGARRAGDWLMRNAFLVDQAMTLVKQGNLGEAEAVLGRKLVRDGKKLRVEGGV